jgi:ABC-type lipoprotein export system ATPase subunit
MVNDAVLIIKLRNIKNDKIIIVVTHDKDIIGEDDVVVNL